MTNNVTSTLVLVTTLHGRFTFNIEQDKRDTEYGIWWHVVYWNAWNKRKAILISIEVREVSINSYRPIIRISTSALAVSFKRGRHSTPRQLSTRLRSSNILLQGFPCVELQPAKLLLGLGVLLFQFPQSVWSTSTAAILHTCQFKATKWLIQSTWMLLFFFFFSFLTFGLHEARLRQKVYNDISSKLLCLLKERQKESQLHEVVRRVPATSPSNVIYIVYAVANTSVIIVSSLSDLIHICRKDKL